MTHTENDIRAVLREHAGHGPAAPPHLDQILGRAARIRRRRRLAAAAGTAGLAVVAGLALLPAVLSGQGGTTPADAVRPSPARPAPDVTSPPPTYQGLRLLTRASSPAMATKVTVTFRPTSTDTAIVVRCAQEGSMVFGFETTRAGRSSTGDLCGPDGVRSKHDEKRYEPGWVGRPHTVTFWVFPPDAPVLRGRATLTCSEMVCDGRYNVQEPGAAERLAARLGESAGAWSVAIYDRPASAE